MPTQPIRTYLLSTQIGVHPRPTQCFNIYPLPSFLSLHCPQTPDREGKKKKKEGRGEREMAISTAIVSATTSKPLHLHILQKPISFSSFKSTHCSVNPSRPSGADSKSSLEMISSIRRGFFDMGVGLLAASMLVLTPLEANATRIEYYATVGEPSCDLNFAKSGLGYCDVAVGTGVEPPYGELINVSLLAINWEFLILGFFFFLISYVGMFCLFGIDRIFLLGFCSWVLCFWLLWCLSYLVL